MLNIINASNFYVYENQHTSYYSPNSYIIDLIKSNPNYDNWKSIYTEFALITINHLNNEIKLIRDHIGLEPLFYYYDKQNIIFASSIPDILKYKPKLSLNTQQIQNTLQQFNDPNVVVYNEETNYIGIKRVLNGTRLKLTPNSINSYKFWDLTHSSKLKDITLTDAIIEFERLLNEGVALMASKSNNLASEFSGGIDSSMVVTSLHQQNITSQLYIHGTIDNSKCEKSDIDNALQVINCFNLYDNVSYIDANSYDLNNVSKLISTLFAGNPEYLFVILANNIHQSITNNHHDVVLSGFGGDECVSSHAELALVLHELLKQCKIKTYYTELLASYKYIRTKPNYIKYLISNIIRSINPKLINKLKQKYPYHSLYNKEYILINGDLSHHVKLRIEESSIIAKHYKFKYYYPLLYPPLLEFCHNLPVSLKRNNGVNRFISRMYLAKYLPHDVYNKHQKIGGITPATMYLIKQQYDNNQYNKLFQDLPFAAFRDTINTKSKNAHVLRQNILLLTLKNFLTSN